VFCGSHIYGLSRTIQFTVIAAHAVFGVADNGLLGCLIQTDYINRTAVDAYSTTVAAISINAFYGHGYVLLSDENVFILLNTSPLAINKGLTSPPPQAKPAEPPPQCSLHSLVDSLERPESSLRTPRP
jgi:hypothetical protein